MDPREPSYLDFGVYKDDAERARDAVARKKSLQRRTGLALIVFGILVSLALSHTVFKQSGDHIEGFLVSAFLVSAPGLLVWWVILAIWDDAWKINNPEVQKIYEKVLLHEAAVKLYEKKKKKSLKQDSETPKDARPKKIEISINEAQLIVDAYGKILEYAGPRGPLGFSIVDEDRLPYPKSLIKNAILTVLNHETNANYIDALKAVYLCLASFQPGVGENEIRAFNLDEDYTNMDKSKLGNAMEDIITWGPWKKLFESEFDSLKRDINSIRTISAR